LNDAAKRASLGKNAMAVMVSNRGATAKTSDELKLLLAPEIKN